jgi:hypothetical protein
MHHGGTETRSFPVKLRLSARGTLGNRREFASR